MAKCKAITGLAVKGLMVDCIGNTAYLTTRQTDGGSPWSSRQLVVVEVHRLDATDVDAGQFERCRRHRKQMIGDTGSVGGVFERFATFNLLSEQRADDAVAMTSRRRIRRVWGGGGSDARWTTSRRRVAVTIQHVITARIRRLEKFRSNRNDVTALKRNTLC